MDWPAIVFVGFVLTSIVYQLVQRGRRERRNEPLKAWVRGQPVTYETRAKVRLRASLGGWVAYKNSFGGVQLVVRTKGIEVSLRGVGGRLVPGVERFLSGGESTMAEDEIGWLGSPFLRRRCIRLSGRDRNSRVDLAISPKGGIDEAWQALLDAGVTPDEGA